MTATVREPHTNTGGYEDVAGLVSIESMKSLQIGKKQDFILQGLPLTKKVTSSLRYVVIGSYCVACLFS